MLAVVTGGAGFLGTAIARRLTGLGLTVALVDIDADALDRVAADIEGAVPYVVDISDESAVDRFAAETSTEHGPWHVLVNNAGITRDGTIAKLEYADFERVLAVNLGAPFLMIRALARMLRMHQPPPWGRVVNVSSLAAANGNFGQANYAAAKAGLEALTRVAARELARYGYTVNSVAPGFLDSPMTSSVPADVRTKRLEQVPLGRAGCAEDIAAAIGWLSTEESGYLTGARIPVNGGLRM